ncbi:MAG TPA: quinone-dependent dihydroorotate dehydrogenase [Caulobacteraceae bacterium]|nr:quinone-dependent dihydroorotate dehydrogenase [Caulobacteraceae bacterium]
MGAWGVAARALSILPPETAHRLTLASLRLGMKPKADAQPDPILACELAGLRLPSPIGLAAGFDKNAVAPDALLEAGFGFVECGTVTPRPQAGNPKPRVFRLREDRAIINRLGFNSGGLGPFAQRLARRARRAHAGVVGANIGANHDSPDRVGDYLEGLERLWGLADYFTLNISSPNTEGLRALQDRDALVELLARVAEARDRRAGAATTTPIFLKVAPDLSEPQIEAIAATAVRFKLDGLIVSNTTVARPAGLRSHHRSQRGGLSGAPLMEPSTRLLAQFRTVTAGRLALVGVGGVASGADAYAKIRAGAGALQLYTALTFAGPGLIAGIGRELAARLRADGFGAVREAVGAT